MDRPFGHRGQVRSHSVGHSPGRCGWFGSPEPVAGLVGDTGFEPVTFLRGDTGVWPSNRLLTSIYAEQYRLSVLDTTGQTRAEKYCYPARMLHVIKGSNA